MNGSPLPEPPDIPGKIIPGAAWEPWKIKFLDYDQSFHLIPLQDKKAHLESIACECDPLDRGNKQAWSGEWFPYFVHQSYDLREIDEWWYYNIAHPELGQTDKDINE